MGQLINLREISSEVFEINFGATNPKETLASEYQQMFVEMYSELKHQRLDKIVLSRIKKAKTNFYPLSIFNRLNEAYADTFNYILSDKVLGCWIGASPELLFSLNDLKIQTVALAGTLTKGENWSEKEKTEQAYVTQFIAGKLDKLEASQVEINGPFTQEVGPVIHLKTEISAQLPAETTWQTIAQELHPTPATCGAPSISAFEHIKALEIHERGLYTGFIGIIGEKSDCFVNLRCMQIVNDEAYLYLGGGLTRASVLENEWDETERKALTLEKILR